MSSGRYDLSSYTVQIELPIQWGDMDAFEHVNNVHYFRFFESARMAYFEQIGFTTSLESLKIGPILGETSCKYRFPLTYPDVITIGARTATYTETELHMEYVIWSRAKADAAAIGKGRIVCFDFVKGARANFPRGLVDAVRSVDPMAEKEGAAR
jgi:acyl-CoA thioester hydrolase